MENAALAEDELCRGSLYDALLKAASSYPDLYALNFIGKRYRYAHLIERVDEFAAALLGAGIGEGDVVSIMLPNCPQAVVALYGANKIGAIANIIHPLMSTTELEYSLSLVNAKMLVTMDVFFDKAQAAIKGSIKRGGGRPCKIVATRIVDELPFYARAVFKMRAKKEELPPRPIREGEGIALYRRFIAAGSEALRAQPKAASCRASRSGADASGKPAVGKPAAGKPAAILFSGGTTGTPKGILLTNGNLNAEAVQVHANLSLPIAPGDRMLCALPLFHGFGLSVCLHTGLCSGAECLLVPRLTVKEYSKVIVRGKCNFIMGVPTLLGKIADLPGGDGLNLSFIKDIISGGDALPAEMRDRIDARLKAGGCNARVREGYGATECTAACAVEPAGGSRAGSFGRMFDGNRCKIIDPQTGEELPAGHDGELLVAGPVVMAGYWQNEDETQKALSTDADGVCWLHTGDIVCRDEEGFLFYRGRIKRMIISSGYNVYPDQIEHELGKLPQVAGSCVIAIPDSYRLHRIKAFVVLSEGFMPTEATRADILRGLKESVARYAWPKEIEFRDSLPLTKVGKIAYRELEKEEAERLASKHDAEASREAV